MATHAKPETTSVARHVPTKQEIAQELKTTPIGQPSERARMMIAERKALNAVAREIANLSWGRNLPDVACRSVAEYCRRYGIDPASEIDILGGRIYRNGNYFIRRGADLRRAGLIANVVVDHINNDPRLVELAKGEGEYAKRAADEIQRRAWHRVQHNVPDEAKGAVLVVIVPSSGAPVVGANYAGCGKKTKDGRMADPVGEESPGKTAETRAYRRAWRHLIDTMPDLKAQDGEIEEEGKEVTAIMAEAVEVDKARSAKARLSAGSEPTPIETEVFRSQADDALEFDEDLEDEILDSEHPQLAEDADGDTPELPLGDKLASRKAKNAVAEGR